MHALAESSSLCTFVLWSFVCDGTDFEIAAKGDFQSSNTFPGWIGAGKKCSVNRVHRLVVFHTLQVDRDFHDVIKAAAIFLQRSTKILHRLKRLIAGVTGLEGTIRFQWNLTTQVDRVSRFS